MEHKIGYNKRIWLNDELSPFTAEAARDLCLSQSNIVNCCNRGY